MINALHLLWIVPVAVCVGLSAAAILAAAAKGDKSPQPDQERPAQENRGTPGLLYDHDCPFDYKCLAMDCMECMEMHAAMEDQNNGGE